MIDVLMPQLGESVAEGTVTKWRVREGDIVVREQPLLDVATDKADTEVPAPSAGRIVKLAVAEGAVVPKGALICQIDETATKAEEQAKPADAPTPAPTPAPPATAAAPLASPSTRKLAREGGVDISQVQGTGEHGRTTQSDVRRAATPPPVSTPTPVTAPASTPAAAPASAVELTQLINAGGGFVPPIPGVGFGSYKVPGYAPRPGDEVVPFSRRRRITADHMVFSKVTAPHVVTVAEVDLQVTSKLRDLHKDRLKKEGVPLTFLAFICAATIRALREYPHLNARVLENSFAVLKEINVGIAVDTPGGLIVPNIKNADQLSLRGLAAQIDAMAIKGRTNKITADDLANTTFSVSNPGLKGNLFGGAIISQPNVGILRMGEIKKRPVVVTRDGEDVIAIHPIMYLALSYDHRVVDGVMANSFLWRVADLLMRGEFEV
jgi:2-oxoglutarate dehydrogenase E2 component (dihydrolipoamide succinyltransferase)